jgi:hypothetical protein
LERNERVDPMNGGYRETFGRCVKDSAIAASGYS